MECQAQGGGIAGILEPGSGSPSSPKQMGSKCKNKWAKSYSTYIDTDPETGETLYNLITCYMWCLQYTINSIWTEVRWTEKKTQNYYNIVIDEDRAQSTEKCLRLQKKTFSKGSRYWDKDKKRWMIKFKVYYSVTRKVPSLPEYKEVYDELRPKLLAMWTKTGYAAHYVDSIIQWAYRTVMRGWKELYEMGIARRKKPVAKRRTIYIKNSLIRIRNKELIITLIPRKEYIRVPLGHQWFLGRVENWKIGAVLIKEIAPKKQYRIILQYTRKKEDFKPRSYLSIDLNMNTIDLLLYSPLTNTKLWIQIDWSKFIQWIRKHSKRRDKTKSKLHHNRKKLRKSMHTMSTKYNHYTDDVIKKLANYIVRIAQLYNALIIVEDLKKQSIYGDFRKKNRELGFRLWKRLILHIQSQWHVKEVNPWRTTRECCICGKDTIVRGLQVYCPKCNRTINRQLNAIINILHRGAKVRVSENHVKQEKIDIKDIL